MQLETGRKVPPSGWKCERCDLKENLWLNLTDGAIHSGRKFWDGSGGNEHALAHYRETGRPLAVKLGTITPDGAGPLCTERPTARMFIIMNFTDVSTCDWVLHGCVNV